MYAIITLEVAQFCSRIGHLKMFGAIDDFCFVVGNILVTYCSKKRKMKNKMDEDNLLKIMVSFVVIFYTYNHMPVIW